MEAQIENNLPEMGKYGTIAIKRWMLFEYGLSGWALLVFALIYETRLKEKAAGWTAAELALWFGKNEDNMRHLLQNLINKGFIVHEGMYFRYVRPKRVRKVKPQTDEERREVLRRGLEMSGVVITQ